MNWETLDWAVLDRLRDGFLSGTAAQGPYWKSPHDLEQYNLTFAERIGWKWDTVLRELKVRGWKAPPPREGTAGLTLLDWACGSGVAGRRTISALGADRFATLLVWDHSNLARDFAVGAARAQFPAMEVREYRASDAIDVLVISHVLNELSPPAREELLALVRRSRAIVWVEPGTHALSRDLIEIRESLRAEFRVVAPCTHREACALLAPENANHWCHGFADPPPAIYADSDWVRFGQRAGIDLRSLPYSFLVLERASDPAEPESPFSRIIGSPRHYKGYAKILNCDANGVVELTLQKRDDPALFKDLKRSTAVPIYRWTRADLRITRADPIEPR